MTTTRREFADLVIVGSGFGGSVVAARLAGTRRVILLEKGRRWKPAEFQQSFDPLYIAGIYDLHVGHGTGIIAGTGLGGGSLIYSMVSLRTPKDAFDWDDATGRRFWPEAFSRASLDPYYDRVESTLGVSRLSWKRPAEADQAWRTVSARDIAFARGLDRLGRTCDALPLAVDHCTDCGYCSLGCRVGAKRSLDLTYLALAEARGLEVRDRSRVLRIGEAVCSGYRVRYEDERTGETREIEAPRLVLAAGAVGTAALLLDARRHGTLPSLSGQVGRNLSLDGDLALGGVVPSLQTDPYRGKIDGSITYDWWDRGFTIQCVRIPLVYLAMGLPFPVADGDGRRWGLGFKRRLRELAHHFLPLGILGRDDAEGEVRLSPSGLPYVRFRPTRRTMAMWHRSIDACREIVEVGLGGTLLPTPFESHGLLGTVHPLGTARIADSPRRGVVDTDCQAFGHEGLYVTDGAAVPGPIGVNTSLTIAAIAERASEILLGA